MRVSDFNYELPPELIAQEPLPERASSRMLVMERATGRCGLRMFREFPEFVRAGDCLVLNDTKVIPARLFGHRASGGRVEFLLVEEERPGLWRSLARPGGKLRIGEQVPLDGLDGVSVTVAGREPDDGLVLLDFGAADVLALLECAGKIPLPPYIEREAGTNDLQWYQTVYARKPGAVAAPTAGLHFTPEILAACEAKGAVLARVTLHVGPGTFRPVKADKIEDHVMHAEAYELTPEAAAAINGARAAGGRVIAIGTTSVRVLETCADSATGTVVPGTGRTRIFLRPPKTPQVTDCLLTNFHLPQSTLLMLVSSFSTLENVQAAYALAIRERLRFFSYGDCMLLV